MEWLTNVAVSIVGAAIWSAIVLITRFGYLRSGKLSGNWYQVAYYADDPTMNGIPWSIELIRVRHQRDTVSGQMWRVHNPHYDRKWYFVGRYDDGHFDCIYWAVKGSGGCGSLHLWRVSDNNLRGRFVESQIIHSGSNISIEYLDAPLEWIRVGSSDESRVLPWLDLAEVEQVKKHVPARSVRLFKRRLSRYFGDSEDAATKRRAVLERLSYGGAFIDLTGPLAMEAEKRRRTQCALEPPDSPGKPMSPEHPIID